MKYRFASSDEEEVKMKEKRGKEARDIPAVSRRIDKLSGVLSAPMTREFCGKPKSIVRTDYLLVASSTKGVLQEG